MRGMFCKFWMCYRVCQSSGVGIMMAFIVCLMRFLDVMICIEVSFSLLLEAWRELLPLSGEKFSIWVFMDHGQILFCFLIAT